MEIDIQGPDIPGLSRELLRSRLSEMLAREGCPEGSELSVVFTDDERIAQLHERWMGISGPTDVLSFPQDDTPAHDSPNVLGDVVVSVDTARRQAEEYGHDAASEVLLLAVHGTLHLIGYDDMSQADREIMRQRERLYVPEAFSGKEVM